MATTVPVSFFNANILDVTVQVNNGAQFNITGAAAPNYTPQLPGSGGPTWNYNGPQPNALGPGDNSIIATPSGSIKPFMFTVQLSKSTQFNSVQFYFFWNSSSTVSWLVLNNGQYVDGSVVTSTAVAKKY